MKLRRKFRNAEEAKKHREAQAAWEALQKKYPAQEFSAADKRQYQEGKRTSLKVPPGRETPNYPSLHTQGYVRLGVSISGPKLSPEMQQREKVAQEQTTKLKKRVAPLYNKGPVQYITDGTDLTTLGKKV